MSSPRRKDRVGGEGRRWSRHRWTSDLAGRLSDCQAARQAGLNEDTQCNCQAARQAGLNEDTHCKVLNAKHRGQSSTGRRIMHGQHQARGRRIMHRQHQARGEATTPTRTRVGRNCESGRRRNVHTPRATNRRRMTMLMIASPSYARSSVCGNAFVNPFMREWSRAARWPDAA